MAGLTVEMVECQFCAVTSNGLKMFEAFIFSH